MQPCAVLRNGKLERTLITRLERLECTPIGGTAVRPCGREGQSEEHGRQAHPRVSNVGRGSVQLRRTYERRKQGL